MFSVNQKQTAHHEFVQQRAGDRGEQVLPPQPSNSHAPVYAQAAEGFYQPIHLRPIDVQNLPSQQRTPGHEGCQETWPRPPASNQFLQFLEPPGPGRVSYMHVFSRHFHLVKRKRYVFCSLYSLEFIQCPRLSSS